MSPSPPHKLFISLSASQTRKRLKGHGFGVRRVEATDRNQSVIFHTATGQHLRELQALFSDVATATSLNELETPIEQLKNLGPASAAWLREIGVASLSDLREIGPVAAFRLVQRRQSGVSLNLLWAMAAALADKDWCDLSDDEKSDLRQQLDDD